MQIDVNKFRQYYNSFYHTHLHIESTILHNKKKLLDELKDGRFCPAKIVKYCDEKCNNYTKISHYDENIIYHIYSQKLPKKKLAKIIQSYKQACCLCKYFGLSKNFNIHLVLAPHKRVFPAMKKLINVENINGGFTSVNGNDIYVFREEEFPKVILHELLHHSPVHSEAWTKYHTDKLKHTFKISPNTRLVANEAVVEVSATIIHCIFVSIAYKQPLEKIINTEVHYSIQQSNKFLTKQRQLPYGLWNEYTNSFCYIVFKTIMLINFSKLTNLTPEYITNFLIAYKDTIPKIKTDNNKSLRMMVTSNL